MKLQIGIDDKTYEVEVEVLEDDSLARVPGYLPPSPIPLTLPSTPIAAAPKPAPDKANVDESKVCRSPVAGVVLRVNARPAQQLQPNDLMLVLEAMKMETNVTAPVAGKVKNVNVNPGDAVKVNQVLVEFE
ncbi:MAG TPA: biotin/lipoyl-containing protein [Terriglobales bacterium]|nr:biotin/lipoyl-containing protein [Terriglobales bacterium]